MGYSNDLRVRVIHVVEDGAAARGARQFVIRDSTAIPLGGALAGDRQLRSQNLMQIRSVAAEEAARMAA